MQMRRTAFAILAQRRLQRRQRQFSSATQFTEGLPPAGCLRSTSRNRYQLCTLSRQIDMAIFGPPTRPDADSRNFVLCPGSAYDRSPCGTGTSAKMAALHGKGHLALGQRWRQESIVGSLFTGWLEADGDQLIPQIQGAAYITGRNTLLFDSQDPFRHGLT